MSSKLSAASAEFADGRWPDGGRMPRAVSFRGLDPSDIDPREIDPREIDRRDFEPPLHPTERDRFENPYWRRLLATFPRALVVGITFCVGIAATLSWQAYGNGARRMVADRFPQLGWFAPLATAPPSIPAPNPPGPATGASPEQLAAISRSLAVVRQSVDKLAADVATLRATRREPPVRTGVPAPPTATSRKPAAQTRPGGPDTIAGR
jgi:hypothetical protein